MQLLDLNSFYWAARYHNFSQAARRLHLTPRNVSTNIKRLEGEVGNLFDRAPGNRPLLNSEGAKFLEAITPIVRSARSLKPRMKKAKRNGSLVVGTFPDLAMHRLPEVVEGFRGRYPRVHTRILTRPYSTLLELVSSGELDLTLSFPPPADELSIEYLELFQCDMVLMTPPEHPLLQRQTVKLSDIAQWPLFFFGPASIIRNRVEQEFRAQELSYEVALELDDMESIKKYVERGMGVTISIDFAFHPGDHEKLGVVDLSHLFPSSSIGVCTLKGKFRSQTVHDFIDTLVAKLSGDSPDVSRLCRGTRRVLGSILRQDGSIAGKT